jgi:hypothetical protein
MRDPVAWWAQLPRHYPPPHPTPCLLQVALESSLRRAEARGGELAAQVALAAQRSAAIRGATPAELADAAAAAAAASHVGPASAFCGAAPAHEPAGRGRSRSSGGRSRRSSESGGGWRCAAAKVADAHAVAVPLACTARGSVRWQRPRLALLKPDRLHAWESPPFRTHTGTQLPLDAGRTRRQVHSGLSRALATQQRAVQEASKAERRVQVRTVGGIGGAEPCGRTEARLLAAPIH